MEKLMSETKFNIDRIVSSESQNCKNMAFMEGILRQNSYFGVDDPTVVFLTTKDPATVCSRMPSFTLYRQ